MESMKDYVIDFIIDGLNDLQGWDCDVYDIHDLSDKLTQSINIDGSATYSTFKAIEYLKEWFHDLNDFEYYHKAILGGKPYHNPITEPELYHCSIIVLGVESVLNDLENEFNIIETIKNNDNKISKTLSHKLIKALEKRKKDYNFIIFN